MKKLILIFAFFLFPTLASASNFPNDAQSFTFDSVDNTTCSSSLSVLMPASSSTRTILHVKATNLNKNSNRADIHLYINDDTFPNQFFDGEKEQVSEGDIWKTWNANTTLRCDKNGSTNDHVFFRIIYTDYNLASSSSSTTNNMGTSTPLSVGQNNDIGRIQYVATTTQISDSQTQTVAEYSVPNMLLNFILAIIALIVVVLFMFKYLRQK